MSDYSHAPPDYVCPFCYLVQGRKHESVASTPEDIVTQDDEVTAFICTRWWTNNRGHVLVIPNQHIENIYSMPTHLLSRVQEVGREIAIAFKETYGCDGVSSRQHNEPAGYQDVWHYHLHVFPRYAGDRLYLESHRTAGPEERMPYAEKLRQWFQENDANGA